MLERQQHETILKNILRNIYTNSQLQAQLAFKGGTCLYLFHKLPRFSTDLDFSLRKGVENNTVKSETLTAILQEYLTIEDYFDKRFTWFWLASYEKGKQRIKIEISKRIYQGDLYADQDFFGLTIRSLDLATMCAHKLCAVTDREKMVNRDLYDTWWLLKNNAPINEKIIQERTGKSLAEYFVYLKKYIEENVDEKHVLLGLGEVLSEPQKDWVRDHLLNELYFQLSIRGNWNFERELGAFSDSPKEEK